MGDSVKSCAEIKVHNIYCCLLIYLAGHVSWKATSLVQCDFFLVNPC